MEYIVYIRISWDTVNKCAFIHLSIKYLLRPYSSGSVLVGGTEHINPIQPQNIGEKMDFIISGMG